MKLTFPSLLFDLVQDMLSELKDLGVDVMLNQQHGILLLSLTECLGDIGFHRCQFLLGPVTRVDLLGDNVVTKFRHVFLAATGFVALNVRSSHISRVFAEDVGDGSLILLHFVLAWMLSEGIQVRMRPGMRGDLVAVGVHPTDCLGPSIDFVNLTSALDVACDEEGGFGSICIE